MGNVCDRWLGCCCCGADTKEASLQFVPASRRNCTDVLFLVLYVASWVGLIATIIIAAKRGGDPEKIYHGVDYNGNTCGRTHITSSRPYAAWVAMPQSTAYINQCNDCAEIMTCVSDCALTASGGDDGTVLNPYSSEKLMYYCIPKLTSITNGTAMVFPYDSQFNSASQPGVARLRRPVHRVAGHPHRRLRGPALLLPLHRPVQAVRRRPRLRHHRPAGGGRLPHVLCAAQDGRDADNTSASDRARAMRGLGIAIAVVTALFLLIVIAPEQAHLHRRGGGQGEQPRRAGHVGAHPLPRLPLPHRPVATSSSSSPPPCTWRRCGPTRPRCSRPTSPASATTARWARPRGRTHSWDQSLKNAFAYVFLHLLWTIEFLVYFTFMVVAGTVANWYFTPRDAHGHKVRGTAEGQLVALPGAGRRRPHASASTWARSPWPRSSSPSSSSSAPW